jgi:hypothetical protein
MLSLTLAASLLAAAVAGALAHPAHSGTPSAASNTTTAAPDAGQRQAKNIDTTPTI